MKPKIRTPYFEIGTKNYIYGDKVLEYALAADKEFGSVESVKAASDLVSPVNGEVLEVNAVLEDAPEKCNSDPYGEGWLIEIESAEGVSELLDAAAYKAHLETL